MANRLEKGRDKMSTAITSSNNNEQKVVAVHQLVAVVVDGTADDWRETVKDVFVGTPCMNLKDCIKEFIYKNTAEKEVNVGGFEEFCKYIDSSYDGGVIGLEAALQTWGTVHNYDITLMHEQFNIQI